jgi:hypothetical protein
MRLYRIEEVGGWDQTFWPTRKQAMERASEIAVHTGMAVEIYEITTVPMTAAVLCNILSGWGGYAASEQLFRRVWPVEVNKEEGEGL